MNPLSPQRVVCVINLHHPVVLPNVDSGLRRCPEGNREWVESNNALIGQWRIELYYDFFGLDKTEILNIVTAVQNAL
jgi:hypothetical protein